MCWVALTIDQIEELIERLDPRGVRERALREQLEKHAPAIFKAIEERDKEALAAAQMAEPVRRSSRVQQRAQERETRSFLLYVNSKRKKQRL